MSQPTLFDLGPDNNPVGMACQKPSRKNPGKIRTGTNAGVSAHYAAKEKPCPECAEYNANRVKKYYAANRENILAKKREEYAADPEAALEHNRKYPPRDPQAAYRKRREWAENNRDRDREYKRRWAKSNNAFTAEVERRRRARKRELPTDGHTHDDITRVNGTVCYLCGEAVDLTLPYGRPDSPEVDHKHPLSREGCPGDILENCFWTHSVCNRVKSNRLVSELTLPFPAPQVA